MTVIGLDKVRAERVAEHLRPILASSGVARVHVDDIDSPEVWRRGARTAARALGSRVRTGISGEWVWAVIEDWQPGPGADRHAARLFAALIRPRRSR